jgi:zinc and cadmium transporter
MCRAVSPLVASLVATFWVSTIALVGIVFLFTRRPGLRAETFLLSFAAGVLLATTFLELIPEAVERGQQEGNIFAAALIAMIGFFFLERVLHGFHVHEESHVVPSRYLILVGDGVHNFIDGVAIAASFAASPELGLATTLAVTVHEVPQELADFSILISGGYSYGRALLLNFVSGLTALLGAYLFFALGDVVERHLAWFMTATAGMFIYIAGSDLIPQVHHHRAAPGALVYLPFLGGVVIIAALAAVLGH